MVVVVFLSHLSGDSVCSQVACAALNRRDAWTPVAQLVLGLVQDVARGFRVGEWLVRVAWYDGSVVEHLEELTCVLGQQNLLLGALDDSGGVYVVGLLELLARNVGQLRFGDERLCLGAHKLLLELWELGGGRLLVLELLDLVGNLERLALSCRGGTHVKATYLGLLIATWLDGALSVTDLFEYSSALLQVGGETVFLFSDLGKQDTELVGNVGDGVVTSFLTPVAQLRGNVCLLFGRGLVCANAVVLGLDQGVQLLGEVGLADSTKRGHGEAVLGGGRMAGIASWGLLRPYGE